MLGTTPRFDSLSAQEGKRLKSQLKVYLRDYASLSADEIAAIWHDEQTVLAEGTWLVPYLEADAWRREVPRAIAQLSREAAQKTRAKGIRQEAKERHLDRQPATDKQQNYLRKLTKKRPELLPAPVESLSKLQASRLIKLALQS
ncbi:MAG TPA: hypothetical protein V6D00_00875 [Pantanalinema sp.]